MLSLCISDIIMITVKGIDYCIISIISKSDSTHLKKISVLDDREFILNAFQTNQY